MLYRSCTNVYITSDQHIQVGLHFNFMLIVQSLSAILSFICIILHAVLIAFKDSVPIHTQGITGTASMLSHWLNYIIIVQLTRVTKRVCGGLVRNDCMGA